MTDSFLPLLRAAKACTGSFAGHTKSAALPPSLSGKRTFRPPSVELQSVTRQKRKATGAVDATRDQNRDHGESWGQSEGSQSTVGEEEAPVAKRKKKRGYRKATHTIRKEETERLRDELAELEAQLAELQRRALAPNCEQERTENKRLYEKVLRHAVRQQQETFVEIQSMMTEFAACNILAGSPIEREINLPRDDTSRRNVLRAIKALKLQDARDFLERRLSHLSPLKSMSEDYRFENDDGDYWAVRFATSQFESATNVKQVFDLVVYYLCNIEISVSEKMGHLTVREDDDNGEPGTTHNRLVSVTGKGLRMESNAIVFSEYLEAEADDQDGYGLIVVDFADEDERYPYRPNERIRKDVNTVMEVRSCTRRISTADEENVVVLTRWSHSRLRHPKFEVPRDGWLELRENMDRWSQNMHKTVMESLDPTTQGPPTWRLDA